MKAVLAKIGTAACLTLTMLNAASAATPTLVKVTLDDKSTGADMSAMKIAIDQDAIKAGRVTFQAENHSTKLMHEMVVVKVPAKDTVLPYNEKETRVIEGRIHHLGEIADLKPGASGKLNLNLKPGHYLLVCNQPGHFMAGMKVAFEVHK